MAPGGQKFWYELDKYFWNEVKEIIYSFLSGIVQGLKPDLFCSHLIQVIKQEKYDRKNTIKELILTFGFSR